MKFFLINESLHEPLLNVANKLLGRQHLNFDQLTPAEQDLCNKFEKSDIYKFLIGEKDTVPEFCSNWLTFSATPKVTIDTDKIAARLTPVPQHHQLQEAIRGYSGSAPTQPSRMLSDRKTKVDYRALHLGQTIKQDIQHTAQEVKQTCKQMRKSVSKSAKATVTKLAPGAFSPKQQPLASAPASLRSSSSSSWTFWPSK
jgi:hypothetical protein